RRRAGGMIGVRRQLAGGFELDDDRERIDVDAVHRFISTESYWGLGRPRSLVQRTVAGSARVVGLGLELVREVVERSFGEVRWMLHTADAQELYRRLGFSEGNSPYPLMERPASRGASAGARQ